MRKKITRFCSMLLAIILLIGILPPGELASAEDVLRINKINVYRTYRDLSDKGTYNISITGQGLSKVQVLYLPTGTGKYVPLGTPDVGSSDYFLQYTIDPNINISHIQIGGKVFEVDETGMPKISRVDPALVNISGETPQTILTGENFANVDNAKITVFANTQNISDKFLGAGNSITLVKDDLSKLDKGYNHIVITRKVSKDGVEIVTTYNQRTRKTFQYFSLRTKQSLSCMKTWEKNHIILKLKIPTEQ